LPLVFSSRKSSPLDRTKQSPAFEDNPALVQQIIALESELSALESRIERQETEINIMINHLYGLTEAEKQLIAAG
jgi:hypothetical protein